MTEFVINMRINTMYHFVILLHFIIVKRSYQIIGGEVTKRGELPYHAALGYDSKRRPGKKDYNCGGTLINRYISLFHVTVG